MTNVSANYENFKKVVVLEVQKLLGSNFVVTEEQVTKQNDISEDALGVRVKGSKVGKIIYLNVYYTDYKDGKPVEKVVENIVSVVRNTDEHGLDDVINDFLSYEAVKDRISFRVMSYALNEEYLKDAAYVRRLDLALVFQVELVVNAVEAGTVVIRDNHMKEWGVGIEDIYLQAFANVSKKGYSFMAMEDVLRGMVPDIEFPGDLSLGMYVLTNDCKIFGASAMFYPGVLRKCVEKMGVEKVLIIPSSVHEVILLGTDKRSDLIREMVREVNATAVSAHEVLSQNVYEYSLKEGQLLICE